jgi:hypothetical protein
MRRARVEESLFRHTARGREALAPPAEGGSHVHYQPLRRTGIGCITSRRDPSIATQQQFLELLAFEMKTDIATVRSILQRDR